MSTSDDKVQAWDIDRLIPAENNNKVHTDVSVAKLAKSMDRIGQISPVIVDKDGVIIAGHGRARAAMTLGWSKIKVIQLDVDRQTAIKMRLADNLMSNQNYDQEAILSEIGELGDMTDIEHMIGDDKMADMLRGMLASDLDMNDEAIADDITKSVEDFETESDERMSQIGDEEAPLRRAFGFDKLTPDQTRRVKRFMAMVIDETGQADPRDAFIEWIDEVMT